MNCQNFALSLSEDKTSVYAIISGTSSEAKLFVERNRGRDGFMCHYFSGTGGTVHQYARSATHTFLVVPGVWASAIIREFGTEVVRGPLFPDDSEGSEAKFVSGDLGVILEAECGEVLEKLNSLKPGCPYRLVRFYSVKI